MFADLLIKADQKQEMRITRKNREEEVVNLFKSLQISSNLLLKKHNLN